MEVIFLFLLYSSGYRKFNNLPTLYWQTTQKKIPRVCALVEQRKNKMKQRLIHVYEYKYAYTYTFERWTVLRGIKQWSSLGLPLSTLFFLNTSNYHKHPLRKFIKSTMSEINIHNIHNIIYDYEYNVLKNFVLQPTIYLRSFYCWHDKYRTPLVSAW